MHYAETNYGFEYGCAKIRRVASDEKKGWIVVAVETPKYAGNGGIHVYITKTGKVRIFDARGEWMQPKRDKPRSGG